MNAAEVIIRHLESEDVRFFFGIPGGALEPIYNAVHESSHIEPILAKHETGAAFMADGYARVSGNIGLCGATTGPGSTNLLTGIASAHADSVPVMALTAQVPTRSFGRGAFQESGPEAVDIVHIFSEFTKYSAMIINPDKTGEMVRRALKLAKSGKPGPVHLNLPTDVMYETAADDIVLPEHYHVKSEPFDRTAVRMAAHCLLEARKPAMLLGSGALVAGATAELRELAELLDIPVATTPKGKSAFPEDHPLFLGVFGFAGSWATEAYLLEGDSDVLLAVGTSFNEWATHGWDPRLAPNKSIIQVDIDPTQFGRNYRCTVGLQGDARIVIRELIYEIKRQLQHAGQQTRNYREPFINVLPHYNEPEKMLSDAIPLKPQRLMHDLRESLPEETIFFADIGNNLAWAIHYLKVTKPKTFIAGIGFGSMGYGVAAAIGGKLAAPDRPVVAIVGDGGFLMNGMEVATAVNHNIPVIWIVENNAQLGMVYHGQQMSARAHVTASEFQRVDFVKIAEGLGARACRVEKPGEINRKLMQEIIDSGQPTVIDVIIDAYEKPPILSRIKSLDKAVSKR